MFRHILVTLDGTPASEPALKQASALAKLTGATLTALSVIERLPAYAASLGEVEDVRVEAEAYFSRLHAAAVGKTPDAPECSWARPFAPGKQPRPSYITVRKATSICW